MDHYASVLEGDSKAFPLDGTYYLKMTVCYAVKPVCDMPKRDKQFAEGYKLGFIGPTKNIESRRQQDGLDQNCPHAENLRNSRIGLISWR